MREALIRTIVTVVTILVMLGVVEAFLRVSPAMIGIPILERFPPSLRGEVAGRLGLSTEADRYVMRSDERGDGGPDIYLHHPNRRYMTAVDEDDLEVGGVPYLDTDSYGFCNPPEIVDRRPIHVLTIGGSIPNCATIRAEDNYTNRLGQILQVNSYNLAVPGVGPYEYLETMRRFGGKLAPQVVVMAISEGNDLRDIERFHAFKENQTSRKKKSETDGLFGVSYALAFFKGGIEVAVKAVKAERDNDDFRYTGTVQGAPVAMNTRNGDIDELRLARRVADGEVSAALYEESTAAFAALARSMGFIPLVVLVPGAYTAYAPSIAYDDPANTAIMKRYSDAQRQWFAENAPKLGLNYFDATAYMQGAAKTRPLLYFPSNVHLTPEGHRALAEAVAPAVRALLPQ